jgi:hypothetical protein
VSGGGDVVAGKAVRHSFNSKASTTCSDDFLATRSSELHFTPHSRAAQYVQMACERGNWPR